MAEAQEDNDHAWRVKKGPYIGDVSALCFVYCPWQLSVPYLLAGSGAQLFLYDIKTGELLCSSHVFDGIRVHGIHSSCCVVQDIDHSCSMRISAVTVAVFGERRVKLFKLQLSEKSEYAKKPEGKISLDLVQILPTFSNWVMDVQFLKGLEKGALKQNNETEQRVIGSLLVIGLSDNSVHIWDIAQAYRVVEVKCSERCLLYSMSLWGDSINTLCVASGTIYNEILVWKIVSREAGVGASNIVVPPCTDTIIECTTQKFRNLQYESLLLNRLTGHEGSIFRIAWAHDGSKFVSTSDDRSARIWICNFNGNDSWAVSHPEIIAGPILFGHSARIWDCYISDVVIITASEDCTCRLWRSTGEHIATIRGHIGRGVWRCSYDPRTSVLIAAGSDSSIKMHHIKTQSFRHLLHTNANATDADDKMEAFKICLHEDLPVGSREYFDSKSEYVRCLKLAQESHLFVATNLGYLHCIDLTTPGQERWTTLVKNSDKEPIVCLDLLVLKSPNSPGFLEDWVAIGDGKGRATVVQLISNNIKHDLSSCFVWSAERPRQLLGIYWCKSLGHRHLFTTDPKGGIKLWKLINPSRERSASHEMVEANPLQNAQASLVAEFLSNFSSRIACIDVNFEDKLLFCGDQRGNIVVFKLPMKIFTTDDVIVQEKVQTFHSFKGAHGISSVVSISVARLNGNLIRICSTGKDGCICSFNFDNEAAVNSSNKLIFTGIKHVPEITMVEGVLNYKNLMGDEMQRRLAAGFSSVDFLLWDLTNESELLRVPCGGWRRPHSYSIGMMPEIQKCFAFLKDHTIYVLRSWVPDDQIKLFPQSLRAQFHGREIHSVQFIPMSTSSYYGQDDHPLPRISWIATGSEDGTVRITRYSSEKMCKLNLSLILGEHVGGSAVRSITTVSKIYRLQLEGQTQQQNISCGIENRDAPLLLLSAGAKQVLTCWLLKWVKEDLDSYDNEAPNKLESAYIPNLEGNYTISFQWLSTYMQPRIHKPTKNLRSGETQGHNGTLPRLGMPECIMLNKSGHCDFDEKKSKLSTDEEIQDDWRYLSMTAFMVQAPDPRSTVCFVVTACSNATLVLHALLLPERLWFEVAVLDHERAPILSLQHVVIPFCYSGSDIMQNRYLVFSGATTGSIAVWDLTDIVNDFILKGLSINFGKDIVAQQRPRTGRGSQGGRRRKVSRNQSRVSEIGNVNAAHVDICNSLSGTTPIEGMEEENSLKTVTNSSCSEEQTEKLQQSECEDGKYSNSPLKGLTDCSVNLDRKGSDEVVSMRRLHNATQIIHPVEVFYRAHQSGVNCLHISAFNDNTSLMTENSGSLYCVVSGGDDQALHIAIFTLKFEQSESKVANNISQNETSTHNESSTNRWSGNCGFPEPKFENSVSNGTKVKPSGHESAEAVYKFTCISRKLICSAHCSSIKGVWTDGHWVFSTGLDQRIRCWKFLFLNKIFTLREHSSSVINVPEPEALHTIASEGRNYYQIAIAGRGMQIVEFSNYDGNLDTDEDAEIQEHK